jgi:uncharacterized RDD family membrane protein YckC
MSDSKNDKDKDKDKDGDWDFKVSEEHLEQVKIKRKATKASGSASTIAPAQLKKPKKKKNLEIDQVERKRISRSAIARRDAALQNYAELMPPTILNRGIATIVDFSIIAGLGYLGYFLRPQLHYHYVKLLAEKGINQTLDPNLLDNGLMGVFVFMSAFLVIYFPAMAFKKTPGKSMMNIRIGHATIGVTPGKMAILMRELIFKPISIVSVIGLLIGIKNDGARCLHDMLTGTALYIDD